MLDNGKNQKYDKSDKKWHNNGRGSITKKSIEEEF